MYAFGANKIRVGGFRASTVQNVNVAGGMTIAWDDATDRREDSGISIDAGSQNVTIAGTPDHIEIMATVKVAIAQTLNAQRTAQLVQVVRSDGKIITSSATGYIRDASDHEEASYNLSAIDYSPIADASYSVTALRETTLTSVVNMENTKSQLTFRVFD